MLEFASLFLSLVTGIHPVEVVVSEPVASVEIVLDGQSVRVIKGEPWKLDCDFGQDPLPRELLAIARDESGRTVKTARQLVNLPKARSDLRLILLGAEGGSPSAVRLVIGSPLFVEPEHIAVGLGGIPLDFETPEFIPLPKTDTSTHHIVTAEVEYTDGSTTHTSITFTQGASGATQSELTAVPVLIAGDLLPTVESLRDWIRVNGEIAKVSTVERPGGRIFMVRDQNASEQLQGKWAGSGTAGFRHPGASRNGGDHNPSRVEERKKRSSDRWCRYRASTRPVTRASKNHSGSRPYSGSRKPVSTGALHTSFRDPAIWPEVSGTSR
jgi:hypothetical protein